MLDFELYQMENIGKNNQAKGGLNVLTYILDAPSFGAHFSKSSKV
jgi:hypothetical protein